MGGYEVPVSPNYAREDVITQITLAKWPSTHIKHFKFSLIKKKSFLTYIK